MMGRRAGLETAAAVAAMLAVPARRRGPAAGDPGSEKARVDSELGRLRDQASSGPSSTQASSPRS